MQVREATVGPLSGTTPVSGCATSMSSGSIASASEAICEKTVLVPWPISVLWQRARALARRVHRHDRSQMVLAGARKAGAVHERGEADAPFPGRAGVLGREAAALGVEVGVRQRRLEQRLHVHGLPNHLSHGARLVLPDEVPAAEFGRRQAERRRDPLHLALEREDALRRAKPAERAVRRRVGRDGAAAHADVRTEIRAGGVNRAPREHDGRERAVRAAVDREVDVHRDEPAVARDAVRCRVREG
jgi:hypothetical protein